MSVMPIPARSKKNSLLLWAILATMLLSIMIGNGYADDSGDRGREVFEKYKDTVVTVRVVVGMSYGGSERENEQEANATLLTDDGLAVLALSAIDPMQLAEGYGAPVDDMTSRIVSLHIIFADGTEKPAEVVLRDKEQDLVFIRLTEKPDTTLPHVSLDTPGHPKVLDELLCIMQYGRVARRTHAAFIDRVEMVVEKPRLFYAMGDSRSRQLVCSPVFTLAGEFTGVGVMRWSSGSSDSDSGDMMVIIVPAEQLKTLMEQVPPRS